MTFGLIGKCQKTMGRFQMNLLVTCHTLFVTDLVIGVDYLSQYCTCEGFLNTWKKVFNLDEEKESGGGFNFLIVVLNMLDLIKLLNNSA